MGWISERAMKTGSGLYTLGPKRKGPLRRIVVKLHGDYNSNLFGCDYVLLECGHKANSYGGKRAICEKCKAGALPDDMKELGYEDAKLVPVADWYKKNFSPEELKLREPK